jgi:Domain of unknown function (DUF4352)
MRYVTGIAVAAVAVVGIACSSGGGDDKASTSSAGDSAKTDAGTTAAVGKPARDGKFEFIVTAKPSCTKTTVGPSEFGEKAQGVFCLVPLTIKNIGKEAQLFDGSSQKAYDPKGTEYSNDAQAEMYANDGNPTFLKEINPGNSVKGNLIFDVPKRTILKKIELHDSAFSGGVTVGF